MFSRIATRCVRNIGLTSVNGRSFSSASNGGKTSKLRQLLDKQNALKASKASSVPSLNSVTSGSRHSAPEGNVGNITQPVYTLPPTPVGEWGIQMVLEYLKTQKVTRCVVFDTFSQSPHDNYAILCNVASVRSMYSLADRLVRQARTYRPKNYIKFEAGKDAEGLWSVADMGTIVVHILTDEGRGTPAFQRFERRLLNEAELVPVSKWNSLKDAWIELEENLINNPPPVYKYSDTSVPPPGYYIRPTRPSIVNRVREQSDSEDEFSYHDKEEKHNLLLDAVETGTVSTRQWDDNVVEFIKVKSIYRDESAFEDDLVNDDASLDAALQMEDSDEYTEEYIEVDDDSNSEEYSVEQSNKIHDADVVYHQKKRTQEPLGLYDGIDEFSNSEEEIYDITNDDEVSLSGPKYAELDEQMVEEEEDIQRKQNDFEDEQLSEEEESETLFKNIR